MAGKGERSKKELERQRFERFITKNVRVFWKGCNKMQKLSDAINRICDKLEKGDGWHGTKRKDNTKEASSNSSDNE